MRLSACSIFGQGADLQKARPGLARDEAETYVWNDECVWFSSCADAVQDMCRSLDRRATDSRLGLRIVVIARRRKEG